MKPMYLKESYRGAYSYIQYGYKGDVVYIVGRDVSNDMILVVNTNDLKFWIKETKLSTEKIEKDAIIRTKPRTKR